MFAASRKPASTSSTPMVAVEEVVGVEGDEASVGVDDVDAGFLDAANIEGVGVEELHDDYPEDVFVGDVICNEHPGKAAQQFPQAACAAPWRMIGGKQFEEIVPDGRVL